MAEKEHIGGRLAANFRKANIAEGLAVQMIRPFAAVAPVAREEDHGIDIIATLFRREGLALKQARVGGDSLMSIAVTAWGVVICGALWATGVAHPKGASEIVAGFPMSAAAQDLRRASHKGRLFKA